MIKNFESNCTLYFMYSGHLINKCLMSRRKERGVQETRKLKEGGRNDRRTLGQFSVLSVCGNHGHGQA